MMLMERRGDAFVFGACYGLAGFMAYFRVVTALRCMGYEAFVHLVPPVMDSGDEIRICINISNSDTLLNLSCVF
jgi:hypothetical protein